MLSGEDTTTTANGTCFATGASAAGSSWGKEATVPIVFGWTPVRVPPPLFQDLLEGDSNAAFYKFRCHFLSFAPVT